MEYKEFIEVTLVQENCCVCGIVFGIPKRVLETRKQDGTEFYCPNGHQLVYQETTVQKLEKQLNKTREQLRREEVARESAENRLRTTKGVVTKLKKRIANGVCPCCNRHFDNLQGHMETKHPDFVETE